MSGGARLQRIRELLDQVEEEVAREPPVNPRERDRRATRLAGLTGELADEATGLAVEHLAVPAVLWTPNDTVPTSGPPVVTVAVAVSTAALPVEE